MRYSANIWVDVIVKLVRYAAQAWLDKSLQDIQLGRRNPWADKVAFKQEMEASFMPMLEAEHARHPLLDIK